MYMYVCMHVCMFGCMNACVMSIPDYASAVMHSFCVCVFVCVFVCVCLLFFASAILLKVSEGKERNEKERKAKGWNGNFCVLYCIYY